MNKRVQAFVYAVQGIKALLKEPHFRFHTFALAVVSAAGFYFDITTSEWTIVLLTSALVLGLEGLNSGIESLADAVHPDHHPLIKKCKDVSAGAVLVSAILAAVIGLIIFLPYLKVFTE